MYVVQEQKQSKWHNNLSSADVFLFTSVSDVMFIFN